MIDKLKGLAFAMAALLAMSGAAAGEAGAEAEFTAAQYPVTLQGATLEEEEHVFGLGGSEFRCEGLELAGEAEGGSTTATLTPAYEGCTWSSYSASVSMNGCAYLLHLGGEIESNPDRHHVAIDLECPEGKEVMVETAEGQCQISIPPQNGLSTTEVENQTADVTLDFGLQGIDYTVANLGFPCPLIAGEFENGAYEGPATLAASSGEEAVEFAADVAPSGGGEKEPAQLTLGESSGVINGSQTSLMIFNRAGRTTDCETVTFSGVAEHKTTTLMLMPAYANCTSSLGPVTVDTGGCTYVLNFEKVTTEGEDDFAAGLSLDCDHEDAISVKIYTSQHNHLVTDSPACEYTFSDTHEGKPSNQNLGQIKLTNKPAGEGTPDNWIEAHVEVGGIVSTRIKGSGLICGPLLETSGTWEGGIELKAESLEGGSIGATMSTDPPEL